MVSRLSNLNNIEIVDTTFREGRQSKFSNQILIAKFPKYLKIMTKLGISSFELSGIFATTKLLRAVAKYPKSEFYFHCYPSSKNWIFFSEKRVVGVSSFVDPAKPNQEIFSDLAKLSKKFKGIRISIENSFGSSKKDLLATTKKVLKISSLKRIGFSDTLGICTPEMVDEIFTAIIPQIPYSVDIEFHFHNDCGLAAANFYHLCEKSFLIKNKIIVSASMGGLGERNGILSLGDVLAIWSRLTPKDIEAKYDLKKYASAYKIIFDSDNIYQRDPLSPDSFFHYAKSHIAKIKKGDKFSALEPKRFGFKNKFSD
ncbi:MAG: hypothetical protein WC640_00385 [Candidatus Paceibacterota bacterium]|jgi:isopropylmalate/homocitrate/citramalate synthase